MKPCSRNRKLITWLALDALENQPARELRAHLEDCEGCRRYLEEVTTVTSSLGAAEIEQDIQTSESFHRRVVAAVREEAPGSLRKIVLAFFHWTQVGWRTALPKIAVMAVVLAALFALVWRSGGPSQRFPPGQTVPPPTSQAHLAPTLANYQMVANSSLEKLDELLTDQGLRNPSPPRTYTAAMSLSGNEPD
jgi:hypothetical protein